MWKRTLIGIQALLWGAAWAQPTRPLERGGGRAHAARCLLCRAGGLPPPGRGLAGRDSLAGGDVPSERGEPLGVRAVVVVEPVADLLAKRPRGPGTVLNQPREERPEVVG